VPRVAILMTHHNDVHPHLAFESALNQTFQDFEIIVCTDTPESLPKVTDKRIRVIEHKSDTCYGKWNVLAKAANSEYNAFLPCDDVWYSNKLETQLQAIGDHAMCVTQVHHVDDDLKPFVSIRAAGIEDVTQLSRSDFDRRFKQGNLIYNPSVMYRAGIHEQIGYWDESLTNLADLDFNIRANRLAGIKVIEKKMVYSHNHDNDIEHLRKTFRAEIQIIRQRYW
jgi:glycosyltransferase involved in cell wall biosynthesis